MGQAEEVPRDGILHEASPLRNSGFARVFWAGVASKSGSSVTAVVLAFFVYSVTHNALALGSVAISETLAGMIFSLPAGTLADRYDRKRLMVLSDVVRGAGIAVLASYLVLIGFSLPFVVSVAFVVAGVGTVFGPAERALIPSLVSKASISDANGLVFSSRSFVSFVGASVAGVMIAAVGAPESLIYNTITFGVSALLLSFIHSTKPSGPTRITKSNLLSETKEGIKWLMSSPGLFQLTISAMFLNFFFTIPFTYYVVYSSALSSSSIVYGLLIGATLAGTAIGSMLVGRTKALRHSGKVWVLGYGFGVGLSVVALVLFPTIAVAMPVSLCMGVFYGFVGITWLTTAQLVVPGEMQGRYFGVDTLGSIAILPLSQLVGGLLVQSQGIMWTFLFSGMGLIITGVVFMLPRSLRRLRVEGGQK